MKMEDFNKLAIAFLGMFLFGFVVPGLIGSILDYFLPGNHFGILLMMMVQIEAIIIIIVKKKGKKEIPGPGDETPWDNDDILDGGKI